MNKYYYYELNVNSGRSYISYVFNNTHNAFMIRLQKTNESYKNTIYREATRQEREDYLSRQSYD